MAHDEGLQITPDGKIKVMKDDGRIMYGVGAEHPNGFQCVAVFCHGSVCTYPEYIPLENPTGSGNWYSSYSCQWVGPPSTGGIQCTYSGFTGHGSEGRCPYFRRAYTTCDWADLDGTPHSVYLMLTADCACYPLGETENREAYCGGQWCTVDGASHTIDSNCDSVGGCIPFHLTPVNGVYHFELQEPTEGDPVAMEQCLTQLPEFNEFGDCDEDPTIDGGHSCDCSAHVSRGGGQPNCYPERWFQKFKYYYSYGGDPHDVDGWKLTWNERFIPPGGSFTYPYTGSWILNSREWTFGGGEHKTDVYLVEPDDSLLDAYDIPGAAYTITGTIILTDPTFTPPP